ncbi:IS4 transposase [Methanophagales archaeon]|nr:IS4 transposase [Methanophagales archaeon]
MGYTVVDFLVSSLFRWIFSEKHPLENAEYSPGAFVRLLMNAAQAKDYVETISGIDQELPNVDTLFWRLSECATKDLILHEYKKVVKRHIEVAKGQIRRRRFIIAIDETHEPFYGRIKNLWIHDYRNGVKGATGSYKYIVVSIVSGNLRFILLVIPIPKISSDTDYYVKELLIFVKSLIPIEIVLLDRGFYSWGVINALQKLKLGYIILVPKYDKFKEWLKKGAGLHDHLGKLKRDKTTYKISTNIVILPDYKGFDWVFATNIKYDKIFRYVRYYKKRWGIETTFRVQDEVIVKTKSSIPMIRIALFVFECMLYNIWQFFKGRVPFRRFVNILFRRHIIKTAVFAVIALLGEKNILDDKGPPPDKIYEELIGKFGYNDGVSL